MKTARLWAKSCCPGLTCSGWWASPSSPGADFLVRHTDKTGASMLRERAGYRLGGPRQRPVALLRAFPGEHGNLPASRLPLAMILRGRGQSARRIHVFIFVLPMWMNFFLRTMAWQTLLEKNGVINGILNWLHLPKQSLINTPWAIILGMVYNFLPFMVLPIYNVLSKIDDNTINAAMDLGANSFQTLIFIWLPLSMPGIISGITMVFVPSLTTFVISDLLGGSKILLIGNVIEQEFTKGSNWHLGSGPPGAHGLHPDQHGDDRQIR